MAIASRTFLLLFLPLTIALYYMVFRSPRYKVFFLLFASYLFYGLGDWKFVPLLLGLSIVTYFFSRRGWFGWGVALNLIALGVFKYWNFGVGNINALTSIFGIDLMGGILKLGLPLGISFYIFKHIGYLLDVKKEKYPASSDILAFLTFSAYFPQISAGPISSYNDTAGQFDQLPDKLDKGNLFEALVYISIGLSKKVLIADTLGDFLASNINQIGGFNGLLPAWYIVIAYTGQLYFDFSGYTDMVIGVSKLFGINLPQNFNNPYLSANPTEFWERWHISLSQWIRDYIFTPLSLSLLKRWGTQRNHVARYVANIVTMTIIGLWHGASWSYILWGTYHGVLLNLNAWMKRRPKRLAAWITKPLFLVALLLGWALFMSPSADYMKYLFQQLAGFEGLGDITLLKKIFFDQATPVLLIAIPVALSGYTEARNFLNSATPTRNRWIAFGLGLLAVFCIWLMKTKIQFLYVQF
jgi:alginate O-acetyltransferase complex protein AlgI